MRARNFNIESLAVSHTDQPDISRMTITLHGDDVAVEQATKQLYRLIDVLKVQDLTDEPTVEHELALVKVRATDANRGEIVRIVELYKARVVDISDDVDHRRGDRHRGGGRRARRAAADLRGQGARPHRDRGHGPRLGHPSRRHSSDDSPKSSGRWRRGAPPPTSEGECASSRVEGANSRSEAAIQ